eukprot:357666-Chlamydomonas_euryale.AAC.1
MYCVWGGKGGRRCWCTHGQVCVQRAHTWMRSQSHRPPPLPCPFCLPPIPCRWARTVQLPDDCRDLEPGCTEWAKAGECEHNSAFMLDKCPKSCPQVRAGRAGASPRAVHSGAALPGSCFFLGSPAWRLFYPGQTCPEVGCPLGSFA